MFTLGKVGTAHSTFTCVTTQEISQNPLLSHSVLVQACGNGHTHTHTQTHTCACAHAHIACVLSPQESGGRCQVCLWSISGSAHKLSSPPSPSLPLSLHLSSSSSSSSSSPASSSRLHYYLSPSSFSLSSSLFPPSTSLGLPISSLLSSPRPLYLPSPPSSFCVCLTRPLFFQFFFSTPVLLQVSLSSPRCL